MQQPMTKHGVKAHLCQLIAKVKRALLRLPHQNRLNHHLLMKTSQDSQSAIISNSDSKFLAIDKSLFLCRCKVFVTDDLKILFNITKI